MKEKLKKMLADKETRKTELTTKSAASTDVTELRGINAELTNINNEITELRGMIDAMPDNVTAPLTPAETPAVARTAAVNGEIPAVVIANAKSEENRAANDTIKTEKETAEKRGKDLLAMKPVNVAVRSLGIIPEKRSITVGSSNLVVPKYYDPTLSSTFNEVSSLVDRVTSKMLIGGESYTKGYITGYGTAGYTTEANNYTPTEPTSAYAEINKTKISAYAEDTVEVLKLPTIDYDSEVMNGIRIASRKFLSREILVGTGATNHLVGIFSSNATAISSATDLELATIDEDTLDSIIFGFGGDENVEDTAVLILNKADLKAFSQLRDANGKKLHTIVVAGNSGTIDTVPFIINSACYAISSSVTADNAYCMAYGPLSNYLLTVFSDMDIQRSTDYLFKTGQIAHRGDIYVGGNVVSKNGFLRVKKSV
jgi:HK97 family phage major capsid protein